MRDFEKELLELADSAVALAGRIRILAIEAGLEKGDALIRECGDPRGRPRGTCRPGRRQGRTTRASACAVTAALRGAGVADPRRGRDDPGRSMGLGIPTLG